MKRTRFLAVRWRPWMACWLLLWQGVAFAEAEAPAPVARPGGGFLYRHEEIAEVPWSIHIARFSRSRSNIVIQTTLAGDSAIGLATVSEQMSRLPRLGLRPMAAVNGDYFARDGSYRGDPEGLQILKEELVSAPNGKSCFWIDADGGWHITNVVSALAVALPGGDLLPVGLNEEMNGDRAVLYSAAVGASTHTSAAREVILERDGDNPWLPLRPGAEMRARVRVVRPKGDATLATNTLVLALPKALEPRAAHLGPGSPVRILLQTNPDLTGARAAIGGGPALVHEGRRTSFRSEAVRHPRTALGWSRDEFFLVQVDGRQPIVSVGMTLTELSDYMLKLGCLEALNLDGGGSSTIWVDGQVMNSPCEGSERPTGNALVVLMNTDRRGAKTNRPAAAAGGSP